ASSSAETAVLRSPAKPLTSLPVAERNFVTTSSTDACERPLTMTRVPSCARVVAIAKPMPAVLPLTGASLPFRSRSIVSPFPFGDLWSTGFGSHVLQLHVIEPPPSTSEAVPVTRPSSSEARQSTEQAGSSELEIRFRAWRLVMTACLPAVSFISRYIPVSIAYASERTSPASAAALPRPPSISAKNGRKLGFAVGPNRLGCVCPCEQRRPGRRAGPRAQGTA